MALEIRSTPVLTGEDAERFIREAEENESRSAVGMMIWMTSFTMMLHCMQSNFLARHIILRQREMTHK